MQALSKSFGFTRWKGVLLFLWIILVKFVRVSFKKNSFKRHFRLGKKEDFLMGSSPSRSTLLIDFRRNLKSLVSRILNTNNDFLSSWDFRCSGFKELLGLNELENQSPSVRRQNSSEYFINEKMRGPGRLIFEKNFLQ